MWNGQVLFANDPISVKQDVDIKGPGRPAHRAGAPELILDRHAGREQLLWVQRGLYLQGRVQEKRAFRRAAHGFGFVHPGRPDQYDPRLVDQRIASASQESHPVAEVAA